MVSTTSKGALLKSASPDVPEHPLAAHQKPALTLRGLMIPGQVDVRVFDILPDLTLRHSSL